MHWHERAIQLRKKHPKMTNMEITEVLNREFPEAIGYEAVKRFLTRQKGRITFEDKKEYTTDDIDEYAKRYTNFRRQWQNSIPSKSRQHSQ